MKKILFLFAFLTIFTASQSVSADFWSDLMDGDDKTSFTEFEGKFEPPDAKNYPDELTKSKNLREYVLKITNFVLSFLGLAAVIAVIYGGVLYVTSGGADEETGKGKKTIQYALLGLVIVIISYALVNTVIQGASTGREPDGSITTTGTSDTGGEELSAGAVSGIEDISQGVENAYLAYTAKADMVDTTANFIEGKIDSEADYANNLSTFKNILNEVADAVSSIAEGTGNLSETTSAATEIISEIDQMLTASTGHNIDVAGIMQANVLLAAKGDCSATDSYNQTLCQLQTEVEGLTNTLETDFESLGDDFSDALGELGKNYAGLGIEQDFFTAMTDIRRLSLSSKSSEVRDVLELLANLSEGASKIASVQAVITATTTKGTAPLTVYFDSFQSVDPAGTIADDKNSWDLNGDGKYASSSQTDCQEVRAGRVGCTYKETGIYTVSLKIESSDAQNVVAGLASIKITVEPSRSQIVLIGKTTTGTSVTLTDISSWKISETEATSGITLDAGATRDGDGNSIKSFTWEFDDGSKPFTEGTGIQTHKYGKTGQYSFELEVEDQLGNKDRKTLTIYVGSPAARIMVTPETGNIETIFSFDGGESQADEGQIINFEWTFTENGSAVKKNEESFQHTFSKPGTY
ncbi:PKD domain-containing protein, partial [Candidatus Peregrinibacteria bacterium]|nr:PKD domain-containing protein [Candidatus Peregrinibacteria bacterium]